MKSSRGWLSQWTSPYYWHALHIVSVAFTPWWIWQSVPKHRGVSLFSQFITHTWSQNHNGFSFIHSDFSKKGETTQMWRRNVTYSGSLHSPLAIQFLTYTLQSASIIMARKTLCVCIGVLYNSRCKGKNTHGTNISLFRINLIWNKPKISRCECSQMCWQRGQNLATGTKQYRINQWPK